MSATTKKIKLCYVLAYKDPNYVRSGSLINALESLSDIELSTAINKTRGVLRYVSTLYQLVKIRITKNPDIYILGFRGVELYWPVRLVTYPKPIIYDEFIEVTNWFVSEHGKVKPGSFAHKVLAFYSRSIIKSAAAVLTDTYDSAKDSSRVSGIAIDKYHPIAVGADEKVFKPTHARQDRKGFRVLFYGSMLPLHGVDHILGAAKQLDKSTTLQMIGGGPDFKAKLDTIIKTGMGAKIEYIPWAEYGQLPGLIACADLSLGGPFGDTDQARRVVTGKTYQSLAVGRATVVGRIKYNEKFIDKNNCLLVNQGSTEDLASAIKWAKKNRSKLEEIGKKGRELYQAEFSQSQIAAQLHDLIKELLLPGDN